MKTVTIIMVLAGTAALAGCNRSPQINEKNASVEEVASKVREASGNGTFVRPGEWQSHVTIEQFDIPGMPPEATKRIKAAVAQNQQHSFNSCLTPEDVKQPKGKFFTGNDECRYDHFTMGGGKIDAAMHCPSAQGMTQVMTMTGTYAPERYDMEMTMRGEGVEGPAGKMVMKMKVESNRVGECHADQVASAK